NENRFASVVGNFPGAVSGNNYTYTVSTGAAPTITDTTTANTYTLQPGSLGGFGSFDIGSGNLTVVMPNKTFVAPLLVGGNIVANSVVGSGTAGVGLVGLGSVTVASTINNSNATAAGAAVMLVGSGAVSVTNGINTMGAYTSGTGLSGNVTLFGSSVSVTGFNNSVNNLASTIDTSSLTGSGGSVFVGSTSSITIGNWSGSTYTSMGEIDTYTSGSGRTAGSVSLLGLGNIQSASVKSGGLSNGNGGQITVASSQVRLSGLTVVSNTNTVGSLVNRSTTTASAGAVGAGLNGFNNDTGTGIAAGIQTSGSFKFLANSLIMDDATKASNYTGAIRVNIANGSGVIAG
ncbi:MAG: hypothetical protein K2X97_09950, partial [Mycobacteriaceae bacterium]|nr:hypothetical protein [Mycobacteriaceae bacterium]